jgi:hypothetical protein
MWLWIPVLVVPVLGPAILGWKIWDGLRRKVSEDPLVWESAIRAFERKQRKHPAPKGAVVFAGSSTIRLWGSLARDMAPLPTIRRRFGGAKVNDGSPNRSLFRFDRVHLNKKGYARWAQVLRPPLLEHWNKHCAEGSVPIYT